jgi:hypothetical protein
MKIKMMIKFNKANSTWWNPKKMTLHNALKIKCIK